MLPLTSKSGAMLMLVETHGTWEQVKGTGKYQGIQGKGSYEGHYISPTDYGVDWVGQSSVPVASK